MKVVFVFTFLFNRCLADVCRGFGYEKDYLPESIDPKEYVNWTPIKEYTNGVELCCIDPCKLALSNHSIRIIGKPKWTIPELATVPFFI